MAELIHRQWASDPTGLRRRDRGGCAYDAYLPDPLSSRRLQLDGEVAEVVAKAEAAIIRLNAGSVAPTNTEALARLLLRAESVASSKIEGLEIGPRRLLRAELEQDLGLVGGDVTANEVLGNIAAMNWPVDAVTSPVAITTELLLETHERLLGGTPLEDRSGQLRTEQNWIGGSDYNPCSATFVPPPPEEVRELMDDLCAFSNLETLPVVAQAAIAHAQFETIHPFVDGNGRTGRVLIHLIMRRRRLAERILPPISLILATWSRDYVDGLTATRYLGAPDSRAAHDGLNQWIALFAEAYIRAVQDAMAFESRCGQLDAGWRQRLGTVRKNSATDLLLQKLPGTPVLTVAAAAALIGRSFQQTNEAVARLADAEVLKPISLRKRNRAFEAKELIDAFIDLERQLASPEGNTRVSRPSRGAPARRTG